MLEKMWEKAKSGYASVKTTSVVPVCALSLSSDVIAVVIYHLVIGALVALPYVIWRKRTRARGQAA